MNLNPKKLAIGGLLILAVLALFFIIRPDDEDDQDKTSVSSKPAITSATSPSGPVKKSKPAPAPVSIPKVVVKDGKPEVDDLKLKFEEGETIKFEVKSDVAEEIHVHGYDEIKEVGAGDTVKLSFPADISGVFEVELENSAIPIATLEVSP